MTDTKSDSTAGPRDPLSWRKGLKLGVLTAPLLGLFVYTLMVRMMSSDLHGHVNALERIMAGTEQWPVHRGFYATAALLSGMSKDRSVLFNACVFIVMVSVVLKLVISYAEGRKIAGPDVNESRWMWLSLALTFAFCFPNPWTLAYGYKYLIGNLTPNVWHNSTAMMLMPFAILQFAAAFRWLESGKRKDLWSLLLWGVLGVLTKPSFVPAFVPAFGLMALLKHGFGKRLVEAAVACALLLAVIFVQKSLLYTDGSEDKLSFSFFDVWLNYHYSAPDPVRSLWFSIGSGLALPVSVLLWRLRLVRDTLVQFAGLTFFFGVLVFALLMETGPRMSHGNLGWQLPVCCYLLYWALGVRAACDVAPGTENKYWGWCAAFLAGAHVVSGMVYLCRGWFLQDYQ